MPSSIPYLCFTFSLNAFLCIPPFLIFGLLSLSMHFYAFLHSSALFSFLSQCVPMHSFILHLCFPLSLNVFLCIPPFLSLHSFSKITPFIFNLPSRIKLKGGGGSGGAGLYYTSVFYWDKVNEKHRADWEKKPSRDQNNVIP